MSTEALIVEWINSHESEAQAIAVGVILDNAADLGNGLLDAIDVNGVKRYMPNAHLAERVYRQIEALATEESLEDAAERGEYEAVLAKV